MLYTTQTHKYGVLVILFKLLINGQLTISLEIKKELEMFYSPCYQLKSKSMYAFKPVASNNQILITKKI